MRRPYYQKRSLANFRPARFRPLVEKLAGGAKTWQVFSGQSKNASVLNQKNLDDREPATNEREIERLLMIHPQLLDLETAGEHASALYYYTIYGLKLASALPCPELHVSTSGAPDIVVLWGSLQEDLIRTPGVYIACQVEPGCFLLNVPGVAKFQIEQGNQILIDPYPGATPAAIRLFLLGSAMGALLHQRGVVPIHGSAIVAPHGAVIFTAPRGYGKSTLAAAFAQRGYPLLADDVCALTIDDAGIWLHPAYPRLNLLPDALSVLGVAPVTDGAEVALMKPFSNKYCVPVDTFNHNATLLSTIYKLSPTGSDHVRLRKLYGFARISELMSNTYRVHFLRELDKEEDHFKQLQRIARQVDVVNVERPQDGYMLEALVDAIEADFSRN
jgi:hypothetical protein